MQAGVVVDVVLGCPRRRPAAPIDQTFAQGAYSSRKSSVSGIPGIPDRMGIIDSFNQSDGYAVLLCQIMAGGVGINLQSAAAVVLLEPQYKPTTEWQAIKRVHRMGQTRRVVVHRFLARDTVDESLRILVGKKAQLFNDYARESAVKEASPAAVDTSDASLARRLVQMELDRQQGTMSDSFGKEVLNPDFVVGV